MRAQWQTPKTRIKEPQTLLNGACLLVCPFVFLSISLLGRTCVFQPCENAGRLFFSVVSFAGPYEAPWPFSQALKKLCRRFLRRLGPSKAPSAVLQILLSAHLLLKLYRRSGRPCKTRRSLPRPRKERCRRRVKAFTMVLEVTPGPLKLLSEEP